MGRQSDRGACCDEKLSTEAGSLACPAASNRSGRPTDWEEIRYSTDYGNPETDFSLGQLTPKHFSFNSHLGACPACHGLGTQLVCDPELMVTDTSKSLAEGAIVPWRRGTKRMQAYYRGLQTALVKHFDVADNIPFEDLPEKFKKALYFGTGDRPIEMNFGGNGRSATKTARPFEGLLPQMQRLYEETRERIHPQPDSRLHESRALLGLRRRAVEAGDSRRHDQGRRAAGN